ncbi:hypothetical protein PS15m_001283 [Mucor circinelloides]
MSNLLPKSLFSASTLKREPVEETVDSYLTQQQSAKRQKHNSGISQSTSQNASSSLPEARSKVANSSTIRSNERSRAPRKKSMSYQIGSDHDNHSDENDEDSSSSSSSSSSSDDDQDEDIEMKMLRQDHVSVSHINHTMHHLLLKLERQQSKQNRYLGKFKQISKSIKKTSRLIGYNANLLAEQCNMNQNIPTRKSTPASAPHTPTQQSPHLAKRSVPFPVKSKHPETIESSSSNESGKEAVTMTSEPPHSAQAPLLPLHQQQQTTKTPAPRTSAPSFPKPKRHVARDFKEISFGRSQTMDIYTIRRKQGDVVFNKKPRSLLYNIADDSMSKGMNELMITTSLDGELQFWNATERRRIKTIGKDHIYDSWIDDICWATPSTLAFCPPQKSDEPVKLVHIGNVTKSNVEGRIQTLDESPHENGISVIGSLETGDYNTRNMEKCSFVTGGYDKSIYLWSLKRESPDDNFIPTGVSRLNIKHTSAIFSLCYDKYKNVLFSGGSDERLVLFDMQTNTTLRELRLAQRVSQIIQSKANPNIMLIT